MQVIPNFGYGGAETMCANLSIELKKMGHDVVVVSLYDLKSSITERIVNNGLKLISLGKKRGFDIKFFLKLASIIYKEKPDVVHSHLYATKYVQILATLLGVKVKVFTIHNEAHKDGTKIDHFVNKILLKHCKVLPVTLSSDLIKSSCELYGPIQSQMPVVFNGIPLDKCIPLTSYSPKAIKFLHIGRFVEAKNHKCLVEGFVMARQKCPDIELFLYGEGTLEANIKHLIDSYDATSYIHLCGISTDVYTVMHNMDVFILPSLWEGFPMTLIEAMGSGLPIIASDVGGIPNMLEDNLSAILIKPKSDCVCNSIISIYENHLLRQKIGCNALKKSVQFSAQAMTIAYLKVYKGG